MNLNRRRFICITAGCLLGARAAIASDSTRKNLRRQP